MAFERREIKRIIVDPPVTVPATPAEPAIPAPAEPGVPVESPASVPA